MSQESTSTLKEIVMDDLEKWLVDNKINLKPSFLKRLCECQRLIDVQRVLYYSQYRGEMKTYYYEEEVLPERIYWKDCDFLMKEGLNVLQLLFDSQYPLVDKFCQSYIKDQSYHSADNDDGCKNDCDPDEEN